MGIPSPLHSSDSEDDHHYDEDNKVYMDEISESTIHSFDDNNSVQLSLPESFDETLTVNGIQIMDDPRQKPVRQKHTNGKSCKLKGNEAMSKADWIQEEKSRIFSLAESSNTSVGLDYNYDRLKFLPKDRMTLLDAAAYAVQTKVAQLSVNQRNEVSRLREQIESLEHEVGEVKRSKKMLAERLENTRSELMVSEGGQHELNNKLRDVHEQMLRYKITEREFEALKLKYKGAEENNQAIRSQLEGLEKKNNDSAIVNKESIQRYVESEKKVQSIMSEKELLQKEMDLLLDRAERLEKDFNQSEARLIDMRSQYEDTIRKAKTNDEKTKADWEAKLASEILRVRQESINEATQLFKHRAEVWERENAQLRESKKDVQNELVHCKNGLSEAREMYDVQMAQQAKVISEKEHEIIDIR